MARAWTAREQKECSLIYSTQGASAAMDYTGRTRPAVVSMMVKLGVKCLESSFQKPAKRVWFAEDVADIFESIQAGVKYRIIAEQYNTKYTIINKVVYTARQKGFSAYPKRG